VLDITFMDNLSCWGLATFISTFPLLGLGNTAIDTGFALLCIAIVGEYSYWPS
jgi:hypothetical protein